MNCKKEPFLTKLLNLVRMQERIDNQDKNEMFSKAVRAGKRTYFFDVKSTKGSEYYLTVTESKKVTDVEGKFFFEKHKIFLYREDFEKFLEGLNETVTFIENCRSANEYNRVASFFEEGYKNEEK